MSKGANFDDERGQEVLHRVNYRRYLSVGGGSRREGDLGGRGVGGGGVLSPSPASKKPKKDGDGCSSSQAMELTESPEYISVRYDFEAPSIMGIFKHCGGVKVCIGLAEEEG